MREMYCPHCGGELPAHDDAKGGRCPSCRLVVGVGRARAEPDDEVRSGGFMANAARREEAEPVAPELAFEALRAVAEEVGCAVERLRMTDYDRAVRDGTAGPSVAQVLATFDTWKAARAAAGADRARAAVGPRALGADRDTEAAGTG